MAHQPTDDFDWVTAQSSCSAAPLFARLREGVSKDVERRNVLAATAERWHFELHGEEDDRFEVTRTGAGFSTARSAVVSFERVGPRIHVSGDGVDVDFTIVVGLNPSGECRYFVGEAEYPGWEVRKMALEMLFFEPGDDEL
jgi:hypothetical protein